MTNQRPPETRCWNCGTVQASIVCSACKADKIRPHRPNISALPIEAVGGLMVSALTSEDPADQEFAAACRDEIKRRRSSDDERRSVPEAI